MQYRIECYILTFRYKLRKSNKPKAKMGLLYKAQSFGFMQMQVSVCNNPTSVDRNIFRNFINSYCIISLFYN